MIKPPFINIFFLSLKYFIKKSVYYFRSWIVFLILIHAACFAKEAVKSLPRFASLKSSEVNMHCGPGLNYRTEWTYIQKGFPVEIVAEFDTWRMIRDMEGNTGWVHQSLLSGTRTAVVINQQYPLYQNAEDTNVTVAFLDINVLGKVISCQKNRCRISIKEHEAKDAQGKAFKCSVEGWIDRAGIWGVYENETKF